MATAPSVPYDISSYFLNLKHGYNVVMMNDHRAFRYICKACMWSITVVPQAVLEMDRPELFAEKLNSHLCLGARTIVSWIGFQGNHRTTITTKLVLEELFPSGPVKR